jgi:hypothetical protein
VIYDARNGTTVTQSRSGNLGSTSEVVSQDGSDRQAGLANLGRLGVRVASEFSSGLDFGNPKILHQNLEFRTSRNISTNPTTRIDKRSECQDLFRTD